MNITLGLAFLAGLASFFSPCVFSLVPVYIGYLSGRTAANMHETDKTSRYETFSHGLAFVLGFSFVFIFLGLTVSTAGQILLDFQWILAKIGGIVVLIFGLHMTGIFPIPFLYYDLRPHSKIDRERSYISSFFMGIFFSFGWSPCIGPVLGAILTIAWNQGATTQGGLLLAAYSFGMALPFLLAAIGIGWVTHILRRHIKFLHYMEIATGGVLIVVGMMLFLGFFQEFSRLGFLIDFGV